MSRSCSCAFLWGPNTSETAKDSIWSALKVHTELKIEVIFHKRNGASFNCLLDIVPIKNEKGQVVLFLVSHKDLTAQKKTSGITTSLLSCGLASTLTPAALVAKRQPALVLPSGNQIPHRVVPIRRGNTAHPVNTSSVPSTSASATPLLNRRASAPQGERESAVCFRFGSTFGIRHSLVPHWNKNEVVSSAPSPPSTHSLSRQQQQPPQASPSSATKTLALPSPNYANHLLIDSESVSDYSQASSKKPKEQVSSSSSSSSPTESDDGTSSSTFKYQRRRSRAVLYHLSGRFDKKNKHNKLNFKRVLPHLSTKNSIPEYKVQDLKASRCILLHYSILKIVWDWLIVLCTFYFAVMVPYNAAFQRDSNERTLRTLDMIIEVLFIVDILLNFRTTFVSKSGQVVHHSKEIALNYIRGWFILDLIAAVPFDVIWTIQSPESPVANWMHLMKLARLLRLARLFQKIERYSQYNAVVLSILMCMFFLLAHWFACGWFGLGSRELMNLKTRNHSWLFELSERTNAYYGANMTGGPSRSSIYISSLYFTMSSLTSVGFGNVSPNTSNEKVFSIVSMLVGALMHAAVFGNVTTIIQRMYTRRSAYQTKNQDLKDFTRAHHLPKQLRQRMLEFYQAMWSINRGIDKQTIMQAFPEEMRGDIALHINREMLSLPIFKSASIGCQKSIAQLIGTRFATPGEYLVHRGDAIRNLYFVCSGSLEILDEEGSVVALLGKCDLFGTDIDDRPFIGLSAFNVKALTYCELQDILLDASLFSILDLYPNYSREFSAALHDELSFNIKEGYDPFAKDDIETLAAITKHSSSPQSLSTLPQCSSEANTDHRLSNSSVTSLHRALEEGDLNASPGLRGSQEHLLGKAQQSRWYLASSSAGSETTVDNLVGGMSIMAKVGEGEESLTSKVKRSLLFSCRAGRVSCQHTNLSMDSFIPSVEEKEATKSIRRICSIERVNEAFLTEYSQAGVPPPTPNRTPPTCDLNPDPLVNNSSEQKELKVLLFTLIRNVQEMRADLQSLATEVSTLRQQQQRRQQLIRPLRTPMSEPDLSPQHHIPKASIMKPSSAPTSAYMVEQYSGSSSSSEGLSRNGSQRTTPSASAASANSQGNVFFSTVSPPSRCVKFNLPDKPKKNHKEKHTHRPERRWNSGQASPDPCDASATVCAASTLDECRK
uniref:Potassium voltage gated channel subfamily H n=1 Tax=Echinococcus granulosus TaxID=6210 RepID=A0A068WG43_ECHGR|nr:potassium voltage gated channel subfamily H [Echinococcus granulosus]